MFYAHLYNSPVGDISLLKDDSDLIGVSFSDQVFCDTKAKYDKNTFKIIIDQLNEYFFEGRKNFTIQYMRIYLMVYLIKTLILKLKMTHHLILF